MLKYVFFILLSFSFYTVQAEKSKADVHLLDFEADKIEGSRKDPNVFMQLEIKQPEFETLIFKRNSFNELFREERK